MKVAAPPIARVARPRGVGPAREPWLPGGARKPDAHAGREAQPVLDGQRSLEVADRVELMLHDNKKLNLITKEDHLSYIGARFRIRLNGLFADKSDAEYGQYLIDRFVLVHIAAEDNEGKFNMLILMLRKLYMFASGSCCFDNPDSAMNQELLLPGHLYNMIIKERLEETLRELG